MVKLVSAHLSLQTESLPQLDYCLAAEDLFCFVEEPSQLLKACLSLSKVKLQEVSRKIIVNFTELET